MASGVEAHAYLDSLEAADHHQLFYYPAAKYWLLHCLTYPRLFFSPDGTQELLLIGGDLLAVLSPHQTGPQYGVTVQIKRFSVEDQGVRLTGAAKHHFRLRKRLPVEANAELLWGEVEILVSFDELCWQRRAKLEGQSREKHANTTLQRVRGRQFPAYCEHAIYALYDVQVLVQKIQNTLLSNIHGEWFYEPHTERLNGRGDEDECDEKASLVHYLSVPSDEQDPKLFALWVAGNLPLDTTQRRELLRINSTVELLRREIELLEQTQEDIFCVLCSSCSSFLAKTCEIFSVTAHGTAGGTFVNPAGHVFHVLTLRNVDPARVFVDMNRSTEHTWFTGYAWNITHCNSCYQHLGWRFDRVDSTRLPVSFFGFRQAALTGSSGFRQIGS
ncbi:unnamed protein product [Peronospora destructor]|uniref:CULT domain-containing protein n=1 Tax=Peronospora destructor TaxID=86335 RepID=A0AAV0VCK7_9STRA|nr:unnamed protein product [Peronospora destructor]